MNERLKRQSACALFAAILPLLAGAGARPDGPAGPARADGVPTAVAPAPRRARVLFLNSYNYNHLTVPPVVEAFRREIGNAADVHYVFLDADLPGGDLVREKAQGRLREFLGRFRVDAVVADGDPAVDFAAANREEYFNSVPLFFTNVNDAQKAQRLGQGTQVASTAEIFPWKETIGIALRQRPGVRKIVTVSDASFASAGAVRQLEQTLYRFPDLQTESFTADARSRAEIIKGLGAYGGEALILFCGFSKDSDGNVYSLASSAELTARAANVPVYSALDVGGTGVLGGCAMSYAWVGRRVGELVKDALRIPRRDTGNAAPADVRCYFDYVQMRRFGISAASLPEGAEILNAPETARAGGFIPYAAFAGLALLALSVILLMLRQKNALLRKLASQGEERDRLVGELAAAERERRKTAELLSRDEVYREAFFSACHSYCYADLTANRVERVANGGACKSPVADLAAGVVVFDELSRKWAEMMMDEDKRVMFTREYGSENLLRIFAAGASEYGSEFQVRDADGNKMVFQHNVLMAKDEAGHVHAMCYTKDVTAKYDKEFHAKTALEEACAAAAHANRAKSLFLANMSHDIRTPMNTIVGFSTMLKENPGNPEKVREYAQKISAANQHLLSLINNVLDMSKIESGKTTLNITEFNLAEVVEEIKTVVYSQAEVKKQDFEVLVDGLQHEWVQGDKIRLNQVLLNLLSNAVKYTPHEGKITMVITELPQVNRNFVSFRFVVADNGIGISEEFLPKIFEPFTREVDSTTNRVHGTGLGMAITKNIVELMGGSISVESQLGKGSAFTLQLEFRIADAKSDVSFWKENSVRRLLVVDDNVSVCEGVKNALAPFGVAVESANNGASAVRMTVESCGAGKPYDLILIDWMMPSIDGLETARRIRREIPDRIPIFMLSAYDRDAVEKDAIAAGFVDILPKPFFASNLAALLRKWNIGVRAGGAAAVSGGAGSDGKYPHLAGKHFLLVEDYDMNAEVATDLIDLAGASCVRVNNGKEAVLRFTRSESGMFDAILMDVQMPIMDGNEAARAIRASRHPEARTIPIVAMTANAFAEDVSLALASGMNAHVAKPLDLDVLETAFAKICGDAGRDSGRN